ncbi:Sec1-like protein [Chytriomyces cf. hyalinus JEL632]|nr:Sec1-like protein [Chytriomyces cf. hyalinus JEL632]
MTSVQEVLKTRVITQVVTQVRTVASKWKVVIADAMARKVLHSCLKTTDILEHNVTIVEMLELKRQPFPDLDAVYLLAPTPDSVELLIGDYSKGKPPYAAVHIFFISALSDTLFEKIQKSPIQKHVQTLKELNMDFLAIEPQAFSLDLPLSLHAILNAQTPSHLNYEMTPIAKRIVSVLASLGEYPSIRYYTPPAGTLTPTASTGQPVVEKLARMVQDELDELARVDKSFPPASQYQRAVLLIVDRGVDVVSPLLHEFTYQAMVHDCLQLEDGSKIVNKHDEGKLATLDENDKIWVSQKYEHIADVLQFIGEGVKKFTSENKAANFAAGNTRGGDQIAAMKETLGALPEFQELKSKFSLHSNMCADMMAIFAKYQHQVLSGTEQNLVTGEDSDFKPVKNISQAVEALLSNKSVCHEDKLRLLMLHIISAEGLPDEQRQRLFDMVRLKPDEYQAVTNLAVLGVKLSESISNRGGDKKNPYGSASLKGGRGRVKDVKFENSRYIPIVKHILEDQAKNAVDTGVFPWIKEPPPSSGVKMASTLGRGASTSSRSGDDEGGSIQRTKPSWATARAAAANRAATSSSSSSTASGPIGNKRPVLDPAVLRANGPRIILFILGGMTHAEMRAANEVMVDTKREVFIGSTHIINPHSFLDSLKTLHKARPPPLKTPFPYDAKPEAKPEPPTVSRSKSSNGGSSSRNKSKDRHRSESDRRGGNGGYDEIESRSKSRRDEGGRGGGGDRYDDRDRDRDRRNDDRGGRGGGGSTPSRSGSYREEERPRGGGSSRDDDRGPSRNGSRNGNYEERSSGSRGGYRDDDRSASSSGRGYRDDDRAASKSGRSDRYPPPTGPPRGKSRDRNGGSSRSGKREDISDRMEQVSLDQPDKTKKKGWFGF